MPAKTKKPTGPAPSRVVRSLVIVVVIAVLMGVSAKMSMNMLNSKMGIDSEDDSAVPADTLTDQQNPETVTMPVFDPVAAIEAGSSTWVPGWKASPCSVFISSDSNALLDSLPESPDAESRATELQLLIEMWADYSGFSSVEIERVWVFTSGDTCFVDMPGTTDWNGMVRTIEGRFISYTVLYPFIAGELLEGYEDGISVRGVPSSR